MGTRLEFSQLTDKHDLTEFDCREQALNSWLRKRALKNSTRGFSKVYILSEQSKVLAYYSISAGAIERKKAPSSLSRNAPNPIPVIILGRLAVDISQQSRGLGAAMLKDCAIRVTRLAQEVGIKAILVHALNGQAVQFYEKYGFKTSRFDENVLLLPVK